MRTEYYILSSNKKNQLKVYEWLPAEEVKGVLQISHGMIEHMLRYEAFAEFLCDRGFVVVGNDHLGHGGSVANEEELGYFQTARDKDGAQTAVADLHRLTCIIKKKYPNVPYFLLGHSMGSFFARQYCMTYGEELDGAIIMATGRQNPLAMVLGDKALATMITLQGDHYRSKLLNDGLKISFNRLFQPVETDCDWLTRDKEEIEIYRNDPLCTFLFTLSGFQTLVDTITFIQKEENIQKIPVDLPLYMTSGSKDPLGEQTAGVKEIYKTYKAAGIKEIQGKIYPDARHELLHETNRLEVFEDIANWLERHTELKRK